MICKTCGETMIGDGYKTVVHCPNVDPWDGDWEPDANPVHCTEEQPEFEGDELQGY